LRYGMISAGAAVVLPILLAVGFATRLAVLPLLGTTGAVTMYATSNQHLCWMLLLLLILTIGPGAISLDAFLATKLRRRWTALGMTFGIWDPELPHVVIVGGGF